MSVCKIQQLSDPIQSRPFQGLDFQEDEFVLVEDEFDCCAGSGQFYESGLRAVRICGLKKRLLLCEGVWEQFQKYWRGFEFPFKKYSNPLTAPEFKDLRFFLEGEETGWKLELPVTKGPSVLWSYALYAAWHLGQEVKVVGFSPSCVDKIFDDNLDLPSVLFVEGINKLYEKNHSIGLESLVSVCYHSRVKTIFHIDWKESQSIKAPPQMVKGFFRKGSFMTRVNDLRKKHPLDFVPGDASSRMQLMCTFNNKEPEV